ncbi:MAG TPA: DinB family protein [Chitinophagaceae bacterium]|nr:DinB family protein [Chitinophagaceae bacterium]
MIIQTPWIERKFEFNFPVGLFPVIIERLRGTLLQLESTVKNIPDEKLSVKKDGKWSVKEVVGHLFDLEELWNGRINDFLEHKQTLRAADMSNAKTTAANHNSKPIDELLKQFIDARNKLITRVNDLDEATASLTALHPRLQTPMRLIDSLFFVAEHDDHELTKIRRLIQA